MAKPLGLLGMENLPCLERPAADDGDDEFAAAEFAEVAADSTAYLADSSSLAAGSPPCYHPLRLTNCSAWKSCQGWRTRALEHD